MAIQIATFFGYLASIFLVIALLVTTDARFRLFSILGNIAFIIYGLVFKGWPVLITNVILLSINIYYLYKLYTHKEDFVLLEFRGEEKLANKFLEFYAADIALYFPSFHSSQLKGNLNFVVLRDLVIANLFSASISQNGDASVLINYTVPKYRDFKIGKFIFEKEKIFLLSKGVKRIAYDKVYNKNHSKFLLVNGFVKEEEQFTKKL